MSEHREIPEAAVEAALETSLRQLGLWGKDLPDGLLEARQDSVRELLEAAAPHMLAGPHPTMSSFVTPANNAHIAMCPQCQVTLG